MKPPNAASPATPQRGFDPDALTRSLRVAGAVLVVASASTFMLQRWNAGDDLLRYGMLVGQLLLLAATSYFVGISVREGRSARTLLALVLATMPASFAVLGGLVYSRFHVEALTSLPHYATWVAPSDASALVAVAATLIVLVPIGVVALVTLARVEARALSLAFFGGNLLLLVPLRTPLLVAIGAGFALVALLGLELSRFSGKPRLDTLEGRLARVMPFAAPLLLLGRVVHLYDAGPAFAGIVLLTVATGLWLVAPRADTETRQDVAACVAALTGVVGWCACFWEIWPELDSYGVRFLASGLPAAFLIGAAALRAANARTWLSRLATVTALGTAVTASLVDLATVPALACILTGVSVAVWGAANRSPLRAGAGSLVALFGIGTQVWLATQHDDVLRWISLSAAGVLLIVGSAFLERNRGRLVRLAQPPPPPPLAETEAA